MHFKCTENANNAISVKPGFLHMIKLDIVFYYYMYQYFPAYTIDYMYIHWIQGTCILVKIEVIMQYYKNSCFWMVLCVDIFHVIILISIGIQLFCMSNTCNYKDSFLFHPCFGQLNEKYMHIILCYHSVSFKRDYFVGTITSGLHAVQSRR